VTDTLLPAKLAEIREEFLELEGNDRLMLLLEFANELPELPERLRDDPALTERVEECQAPVYITLEVEDGRVHMFATAPREAPTTRGFASILVQGLDDLTADELAAVPADFPQMLGLNELVSPLRVRGMTGMLGRAKRQVAARVAADGAGR
jgi:cysteine desulfuration protein SufE